MSTGVLREVPDLPDDQRLVDVLRRGAYMVAAAGHFVFPVRPWQKTPAVQDWEHVATRDALQIHRWWRTRPYNIGIACGPVWADRRRPGPEQGRTGARAVHRRPART